MWKTTFKEQFDNYVEDESLVRYNTYRTGGIAKFVITIHSKEELLNLILFCKENKVVYKVIGKGSNLIIGDKFFEGIIIILKGLNKIVYHNNIVICEAGVAMPKLAFDLANHDLSGFEFAAGIPGTVGGGCFMNAGAYKKDFSTVVKEVEVIDVNGIIKKYSKDEMKYTYRHSILKETEEIVLSVTFEFEKSEKLKILEIMKDRKARREDTQPLNHLSAGSVFKNVEGEFVWKLIDDCGLRGFQIGGALFSQKHPNFIVNDFECVSDDIIQLIELAKVKVKEKFNLDLVLEQEKFNC